MNCEGERNKPAAGVFRHVITLSAFVVSPCNSRVVDLFILFFTYYQFSEVTWSPFSLIGLARLIDYLRIATVIIVINSLIAKRVIFKIDAYEFYVHLILLFYEIRHFEYRWLKNAYCVNIRLPSPSSEKYCLKWMFSFLIYQFCMGLF